MNQTFITREQLLILLDSLSSSDNLLRTQSEANLKEAQKLNGIGVELTKISLDSSLPVHLRQVKRIIKELNFFFSYFIFQIQKLGALTLKKYVKENWLEGEDSFVGPQTSDQDKQQIRQLLPNGLSDPESKIRTVVVIIFLFFFKLNICN